MKDRKKQKTTKKKLKKFKKMKDKATLTNEELENKLIELLIENFKENIKDSEEFIRQNSGIIIAAAFSMIILLLSFIPQRTLLLDIGIVFLVISVVFQFELFHQTPEFSSDLDKSNPLEAFKKMKSQTFLQIFGTTSFFIGLIFLLSHFQIFYISFGLIIYLNTKCTWRIFSKNKFKNKLKNDKFKMESLSISINEIQIGKKVLKHFKIIIFFEIILEITIIISSFLVILNWVFIIY